MDSDHLCVSNPIRPEDLDRHVTRQGVYPSLPASPGVPWSTYVRSQRSQRVSSRSVSSSTEALDSDQARHTTRRILQHTRSLPTDSPVPQILTTDREYRSDSGLSDRYTTKIPRATGINRSSYRGYMTEHDDYATLGSITPTSSSVGMFVRPKTKSVSSYGSHMPKGKVNRHSINSLINAVHTAAQDIDNLYNLTTSLASSITFNQMILHIRSVFANLQDSMQYLHTLSTHTMDYINAATTGTLSPHVLSVLDLQKMLQHIADTLPPTLHLLISPVDTLHFYRYLHTHVLIENKQFLLLINIPIQVRAHQITIHHVFTLDIPHGNYSAHYDINTQYYGVTKEATMGLELSCTQLEACKQANGQFCHISMPFQPLANPPTCIAALYACYGLFSFIA